MRTGISDTVLEFSLVLHYASEVIGLLKEISNMTWQCEFWHWSKDLHRQGNSIIKITQITHIFQNVNTMILDLAFLYTSNSPFKFNLWYLIWFLEPSQKFFLSKVKSKPWTLHEIAQHWTKKSHNVYLSNLTSLYFENNY